MAEVKIRYREVMQQAGPGREYGRFPEYQVVQGRKILSRHDLREQAERWCEKNGHTLSSTHQPAAED